MKHLRLLLLLVPIAVCYLWSLHSSPIYLAHDEVVNTMSARSIASSGHDLEGRLFPVYFHITGNYWATPMTIYFTALWLTFLPVSETVTRLPSVVVGLADIVLIYFLARRIFKRELLAMVAAAILALTPAHFIHSRLGVDHLYPVPFVIGWLLCLFTFSERRRPGILFAGTALLGIGAYTYMASLIMMPLYLALTGVTLYHLQVRSVRPYAAAVLGFLVPTIPLVIWHVLHPEQHNQQIQMYSLYDSTRLNPLQGLKDLLSYTSLTERTSVYFDFFNASFLFFSGDASLINATRKAGVFLFPLVVLLPAGFYQVLTARRTPLTLLVLAGFLTSPLAASFVAEHYRINRALVMLPFAALIATFGLDYFLQAGHRVRQTIGIGLIALLPVQFAVFCADYHSDYRTRSSIWFERNIRGALEDIMRRDEEAPAPKIHLSTAVQWIEWYWPYYTAKQRRPALLDRTVYFDPKYLDETNISQGSLVLRNVDSVGDPLASTSTLEKVATITEPDGAASFWIFRK